MKRPNIEIITNEEVWEIKWNFFVEEIALKSWKSIKADWIFIAVWTLPNNSLVKEIWVEFDNEGCVVVDKRQETKVKWLYAAWETNNYVCCWMMFGCKFCTWGFIKRIRKKLSIYLKAFFDALIFKIAFLYGEDVLNWIILHNVYFSYHKSSYKSLFDLEFISFNISQTVFSNLIFNSLNVKFE